MNFGRVRVASSGPQAFICRHCTQRIFQNREDVWADRDGPSFQYHCTKCASELSAPGCKECSDYDRPHGESTCPRHPNYDPTPYCTVCGDGKGICCTGPRAEYD